MKKVVFGVVAALVVVVAAIFLGMPAIDRQVASELRAELEQSGDVKVTGVEVGLLKRRIVLSGLVITGQTGADFELKVARLDVEGLSWPVTEVLHGRTPFSAFRWGDPVRASRIEAQEVRLIDRAAMTEWQAKSIVGNDIDLARFDGNVIGRDLGSELPARTLRALRVGDLEQQGISFTSSIGAQTTTLKSVSMQHFDRGLVGKFRIDSLTSGVKGLPSTGVRVREISAEGLDLRKPLDALATGQKRLGQPLGRLWADHLAINGIDGPAFDAYGFSLGSITTEQKKETDSVIVSRTRINGLTLNPPANNAKMAALRGTLESIGVKELKMDVDCSAREDRQANIFEVEKCSIASPELAIIGFDMKVVDVNASFWRAVDEGDFSQLSTAKAALGDAKLVLADKGLLDRIFKAAAKNTGTPLVLLRPLTAMQIRKYQPPGVLITEDFTKLAETFGQFVEQGGTLTLTAHPEPPFSFSRAAALLTPGPDLVGVLGLSATLSK